MATPIADLTLDNVCATALVDQTQAAVSAAAGHDQTRIEQIIDVDELMVQEQLLNQCERDENGSKEPELVALSQQLRHPGGMERTARGHR